MNPPVPIIVLTPVKDEEWILEHFLRVTSVFADRIIVADQGSTDASRAICARFPKVVVVDNAGTAYDEAARSVMLIDAARRLVPGSKLLVALDADEIASADSLHSAEWNRLRSLPPGTGILFRKPNVLISPIRAATADDFFALGFVDDGRPHLGSLIHSCRVPAADRTERAESIRFLHLAAVRLHEYRARQAFYCMLENVNATKGWVKRAQYYSRPAFSCLLDAPGSPIPPAWTDGLGFDLAALPSARFNRFHARCLELFWRHGWRRFRWDDIWWENWGEAAEVTGHAPPGHPSLLVALARHIAIKALFLAFRLRAAVRDLRR